VPVLVAAVSLRDSVTNRALLLRSLALLTLLGGATLIAFTVAPKLIITVMLGSKYLTFADQLPRLSLAIFILSVANLLVSYFVALRRRRIALAAGLGLLSMVILLGFQHQSVAAVVTSLIEGSLTFLILVVAVISWKIKPGRAAL
jgi:O-antigen/teichoic acid export membrane protein